MDNLFRFPSDRTFFIAEIGINHNGNLDIAKQLIDVAASAGCDAVKFQIKTPHMSLPPHLWDQERDTPWGERMTYLQYRQRMELSPSDYMTIVRYCAEKRILFSASAWDNNAADKLYAFEAPFIKIASASVTNLPLIQHISRMNRPVVMSTGMSTLAEIRQAVFLLRTGNVPQIGLLACTSTYPCRPEHLNLARIHTLKDEFPDCVLGYSGHEPGLWTTLCAVAMGAKIIERHITLDRTMKGSDHASSIEPVGLHLLMREIRTFAVALGTGDIGPQPCEAADIARLRISNPLTGATQS